MLKILFYRVEDNEEELNEPLKENNQIRKAVIVRADVEKRPTSLEMERTKRFHQVRLIQKPR